MGIDLDTNPDVASISVRMFVVVNFEFVVVVVVVIMIGLLFDNEDDELGINATSLNSCDEPSGGAIILFVSSLQ